MYMFTPGNYYWSVTLAFLASAVSYHCQMFVPFKHKSPAPTSNLVAREDTTSSDVYLVAERSYKGRYRPAFEDSPVSSVLESTVNWLNSNSPLPGSRKTHPPIYNRIHPLVVHLVDHLLNTLASTYNRTLPLNTAVEESVVDQVFGYAHQWSLPAVVTGGVVVLMGYVTLVLVYVWHHRRLRMQLARASTHRSSAPTGASTSAATTKKATSTAASGTHTVFKNQQQQSQSTDRRPPDICRTATARRQANIPPVHRNQRRSSGGRPRLPMETINELDVPQEQTEELEEPSGTKSDR